MASGVNCGSSALNEELRGENLTEIREEVNKVNFVNIQVVGLVEGDKKNTEYMFYKPLTFILQL